MTEEKYVLLEGWGKDYFEKELNHYIELGYIPIWTTFTSLMADNGLSIFYATLLKKEGKNGS